MEASKNEKNYAGKIIALTFILSLGYAILRYHIVGNVPWKDFPFLILNKGISLAAFIILTLNFTIKYSTMKSKKGKTKKKKGKQ